MFTGQDRLIKVERSWYPYIQGQGSFPWYLFPFCKKCLLKLSPSQWVRTFAHWSVKVYLDGWTPCGTEKEWEGKSRLASVLYLEKSYSSTVWAEVRSYPPVGCSHRTYMRVSYVYSDYTLISPNRSCLKKTPLFECCQLSLSYSSLLVRLWCSYRKNKHETTGQLAQDSVLYLEGRFVPLLSANNHFFLSWGPIWTMRQYLTGVLAENNIWSECCMKMANKQIGLETSGTIS